MNFFNRIWTFILNLFGRKSVAPNQGSSTDQFTQDYEETDRVNFTAIMSAALANKAVTDSGFNVTDEAGNDTRRSEWIQEGLHIVWDKIAREVTQELGKGGKVFVPYVQDGTVYVDSIDQSRMRITAMQGDEITGATLMAESVFIGKDQYFRWCDYTLDGNVHTIRQRVTNANGAEVPLSTVPQWEDIEPEFSIAGVEHLLLAYLKSPADNRTDDQMYGVPITYGSETIIEELHNCVRDMAREYDVKKAFVGADSRMFGKDNQLPANGLFRKFNGTNLTGDAFWEVYDPAIRDSAYLNRYEHLCGLLESSVGVSPGILTHPVTQAATATEIKAANAATFAYIDAIRSSIETAFKQLAYAMDVLAEYTGATPAGAMGERQITWDWDTSMTESSTETFSQMSELESRGLLLPERLVAWTTGMDMGAAEEEVRAAQERKSRPIDELLKEEE